jgi:hypothetical protein
MKRGEHDPKMHAVAQRTVRRGLRFTCGTRKASKKATSGRLLEVKASSALRDRRLARRGGLPALERPRPLYMGIKKRGREPEQQ